MTNPWYYVRSGYRRLKRFVVWFPVLWKDEDWDSAYLFEIMRFKISRIRKEIEKNQRHVGWERAVRNMKIAEELLSRCGLSDFYWDLAEQIENEEKRGKCACPEETFGFEPCGVDLKTGKSMGSRFIDLSCDYCKTSRMRWYKRQDAKELADFEFLFCHLKKHAKKWWD